MKKKYTEADTPPADQPDEWLYVHHNSKEMKTYPIAKINLGLNIVRRRPDGYHDLETVFYPVPLCDELNVEPMADDDPCPHPCDLLMADGGKLDCDPQQNLVVRAYQLLRQEFPHLPRVRATLRKVIPSQAGMGGGSSDCASMLCLLNEQFQLGLTPEQLIERAAWLGADCPFFVIAQPAYAEGIGERLVPIHLDLSGWYLAIVRPDIPVPTREAFALIKPQQPLQNCRDIVARPVEEWKDALTNDFEASVFVQHPELGAVKQQLYRLGAVYAAMSGSGSSLFGLFRHDIQLEEHFTDMFTKTILL